MGQTLDSLTASQLTILRHLCKHPSTEVELAYQVTQQCGHTSDQTTQQMDQWLESLRQAGLIWTGKLFNAGDHAIRAAALTSTGRELIDRHPDVRPLAVP